MKNADSVKSGTSVTTTNSPQVTPTQPIVTRGNVRDMIKSVMDETLRPEKSLASRPMTFESYKDTLMSQSRTGVASAISHPRDVKQSRRSISAATVENAVRDALTKHTDAPKSHAATIESAVRDALAKHMDAPKFCAATVETAVRDALETHMNPQNPRAARLQPSRNEKMSSMLY
ncbi:hypothetical protein T484DRAFT_1755120 [Baffinella frigidus]|nr:hypothetical protein T484DRAFT_1755120 [Cryptophyta sp. CCMP2293]